MNLHQIASGAIGAVNPFVPVSVQVYDGNDIAADGRRTPRYLPAVTISAQVQPMSSRDLQQTEGLNIQGYQRAIYLNGAIDGVVRLSNQGGDLVTTPDGVVWLVTMVLERWPDWCKVAVTMQNGS